MIVAFLAPSDKSFISITALPSTTWAEADLPSTLMLTLPVASGFKLTMNLVGFPYFVSSTIATIFNVFFWTSNSFEIESE